MSDPRESRPWELVEVVHPAGGVSKESLELQEAIGVEVDIALRRCARITCLTQDRPPLPGADLNYYFDRGWGRARMWQQYGQEHSGAVLVFDQDQLVSSLDDAHESGDGDVFSPSPVHYEDAPVKVPLRGSFESLDELHDALDQLTSTRFSIASLFFRKNTDWASENEYRVVISSGVRSATRRPGVPLDLPYGNSLKAIVLGERWDGSDWLQSSAAARGLRPEDITRCRWFNGAPVLRHYPDAG